MAKQAESWRRPMRKVAARYECTEGFWRERLECGHFVKTKQHVKLLPTSRRKCYDCPRRWYTPNMFAERAKEA